MVNPDPENLTTTKIIESVGHWTAVLTIVGFLLPIPWGRWSLALSLLMGGALAWFGYRAHIQIVDRALFQARQRWLPAKVFLRYGLIIIAVYVIIRTSYFDLAGFFIGLLLPAAAVIIESIRYLIRNIRGV
jgi:hypothetical protein